jgi:hypothetical protein
MDKTITFDQHRLSIPPIGNGIIVSLVFMPLALLQVNRKQKALREYFTRAVLFVF